MDLHGDGLEINRAAIKKMKISNRRIKKMNKQIRLTTICFTAALIFCAVATTVTAQVATGGSYTLNQSVIASGGGQNSTGGGFTVDGTVGQAAAGTNSSGSPFAVKSGFWTAEVFTPTAAGVSVSGRVRMTNGKGIRNVLITLTESDGTTRTTLSGFSGSYRFSEVAAGQTVILSATAKRFSFSQPTQVLSLTEDESGIDFIGIGQWFPAQ